MEFVNIIEFIKNFRNLDIPVALYKAEILIVNIMAIFFILQTLDSNI